MVVGHKCDSDPAWLRLQCRLAAVAPIQFPYAAGEALKRIKNKKGSRRKEIIKIRAEPNSNFKKKTIEKMHETKSWFFEKINETDKSLARLIKKKRRFKSNKVRNEKEVTNNATEVKRIIKDYYDKLYTNTKDYLKKQTNF